MKIKEELLEKFIIIDEDAVKTCDHHCHDLIVRHKEKNRIYKINLAIVIQANIHSVNIGYFKISILNERFDYITLIDKRIFEEKSYGAEIGNCDNSKLIEHCLQTIINFNID